MLPFGAKTLRAVLCAILLMAPLSGCGRTEPESEAHPSSREGRPNVVLIVMDTVRADHLSCYGYERDTTPFLTELAREGRLYTNAHSTSCWTGPSHASLFTGLFPAAHGATQMNWTLQHRWTTLAESFGEIGYFSIGIVENAILNRERQFDQGFDVYHEVWKHDDFQKGWAGLQRGQKNVALDLFADSITSYLSDAPFFIFVNLIEAHYPYVNAGQFEGLFTDQSERAFDWSNYFPEFLLGDVSYSEEDFQYLVGRYDEEIRYVDETIRGMAEVLKTAELWDDTIFVVTADHGENIGDHGMVDHIFNLYESVLHIPLIVRYPESIEPGSVERAPVQLVDVYPTLLSMTGADISEHEFHGVDLTNAEVPPDRPVFAEYDYPKQALGLFPEHRREHPLLDPFKRRLRSITENGIKFIWGSDGRHELYSIETDPDELVNLIDDPAHAGLADTLSKRAEALRDHYRVEPDATRIEERELSAETIEALRTLGYVE